MECSKLLALCSLERLCQFLYPQCSFLCLAASGNKDKVKEHGCAAGTCSSCSFPKGESDFLVLQPPFALPGNLPDGKTGDNLFRHKDTALSVYNDSHPAHQRTLGSFANSKRSSQLERLGVGAGSRLQLNINHNIKHLQSPYSGAGNSAKHLTWIMSLMPQDNPVRSGLSLSPL